MTRHGQTVDARLAALAADRALLTVAAATVAAGGALVAACAPTTPRTAAARRTAAAQRTAAPDAEVGRVLAGAGATGPAQAVWLPNARWVDGDPGAEPFVRALEWVAVTGPAGSPTGTVTAWQDPAGDGGVTVAAADQDAGLAAALTTVGPADTVVRDRDDWLVVSDDSVRSLLAPLGTEVTAPWSVAGYRSLLARRTPGATGGPGPLRG